MWLYVLEVSVFETHHRDFYYVDFVFLKSSFVCVLFLWRDTLWLLFGSKLGNTKQYHFIPCCFGVSIYFIFFVNTPKAVKLLKKSIQSEGFVVVKKAIHNPLKRNQQMQYLFFFISRTWNNENQLLISYIQDAKSLYPF